jgi:hypothetical protein
MSTHLSEELAKTATPVQVVTPFGPLKGGRVQNGAAVFLGTYHISFQRTDKVAHIDS